MNRIHNLLDQLDKELLSEEPKILKCMKMGRLVAKYYNDTTVLEWINKELNGYVQTDKLLEKSNLPKYRLLTCMLKTPYFEQHPIGWNQALQIKGNRFDKMPDFSFLGSLSQVIDLSKKEIIDFTRDLNGANYTLVINGSEFKNVIMGVTLKLLDYVNEKMESLGNTLEDTCLMNIFNKFHGIAKRLENRYDNRPTIIIENEYDVQDLLNALLYEHFDSIQVEEYGHMYAGKRPRVDFFLRYDEIAIEVKCVRDSNHANRILREEIILDIAYYSKRKEFKHLYFFIYDPKSLLLNRTDFIKDLEENVPENYSSIKIVIKPDL
ncbi:MAG: hypothetical protein K9W44_16365 [Candidatus Lokiarchaeota archaeon]|nr:hypothetical protein [Candidatus Harpocratesius repetitus]